jgi:hypothetical protein
MPPLLLGCAVLQVRAQLGSSVNIYHIAFLDPRSPAHILRSAPAGAPAVSFFDHNKQKYPGSDLQLLCDEDGEPLLPCIGVRLSETACSGKTLQECYISYPVEVRW